MAKTYYSNTSLGNSSTTSTTYQDKVTLTFTPVASTNYAIFFTCLVTQSSTSSDVRVQLYNSTDAIQMYEVILTPKDTTDQMAVTGVAIYEEGISPASTTFSLQYCRRSGSTAKIQDAYLTAVELVGTDIFNNTLTHTSITGGSDGTDGDDQYQTLNTLTVPPGDYTIVGSCAYSSDQTSASSDVRTRLLLWDDTNNNPYGYIDSSYLAGSDVDYPYWYVMNASPAANTNYDLRAAEDWNSIMTASFRTILALDRSEFRHVYSSHAENGQTTVSTSDQTAETITVNLDRAGNNLILGSWWGSYNNTSRSWLSNIQINGSDVYTTDISVEPEDRVSSFTGSSGSLWSAGFAGIQNLSSGNNTIEIIWKGEGTDSSTVARTNITGFDLDNYIGFDWNVKDSGTWKISTAFYAKDAGTWKPATNVYVKSSGTWQSIASEATFTGETVDATSSSYTSAFPNPPVSPPPVSCFFAWQKVLMADGTTKPIGEIITGDRVCGRWSINTVRAIQKPILGNRSMWKLNNICYNTAEHPTWTKTGWAVIDYDYYVNNDWMGEFELFDNTNNTSWKEIYRPCHPDKMNILKPNVHELAIYGSLKWMPLTSMIEDTNFAPDTQLYSLALDNCRTMYVDGFCFSGWADESIIDYDSKIGT